MMFKVEDIQCTLKTEAGPISLRDFAYFLSNFRLVYVAAESIIRNNPGRYSAKRPEDVSHLTQKVVDTLRGATEKELATYALAELSGSEDLCIVDVARLNPVNFTFKGIAVCLAVAVAISGGEISIGPGGISAKLPPLGEGISKLRTAFDDDHKIHLGTTKPKPKK